MHPFCRIVLLLTALVLSAGLVAGARVLPVPVPPELKSSLFTVQIDGKSVDVAHAAASYDFVSANATGPIKISITANQDGFWDSGVDIQPWRLGIRPIRNGRTIQFRMAAPGKLAISRPGDFLNHATMLFIFISRPTAPPTKLEASLPGFHFVAPGPHHGSLNPRSGETWYLAPGAVIYGSINLWKVNHVSVTGQGVVVYDGPQNPNDDDGWMQKPDWHCIGALEAHNVHIQGVTCIVRSRTWSIQMKDSSDFLYDDLRVIGGNPGNANQDGMDWLGGGDTIVRNSFFRASDDVFAIQGNWDGYDENAMVAPGHDVANILVENSLLSTSISNIVRAGWPQKTFNSRNFTLRNSDILHSGIGSCGLPFALFTYWGANGAQGQHGGYTFENLWLDDWYSLFQIEQENPALHDFTFRNIWALGQPPLVPSQLRGQIKDVRVENVKYGQALVTSNANLPVQVSGGAQSPTYSGPDKAVRSEFHISPAVPEPHLKTTFTARIASPDASYTWLFGDGTTATGRQVRHRFPDALGTELDGATGPHSFGIGAGRFRVILHVQDKQGHQDWSSQDIVVVGTWHKSEAPRTTQAGLTYHIYPGTWPQLPRFASETPTRSGIAANLPAIDSGGFTRFAVTYDGFLNIQVDGGYNFRLLARDGARLVIDGQTITETGPPFGEVCGSPMNAMRYAPGSIGLRAGKHTLRLEVLESVSPGNARLLWDGPGIPISDIPDSAFSHAVPADPGPTQRTLIDSVTP